MNAAKHCQGLPRNTANFGALGVIGWKSIQAHIDIIRLNFLWRLLLLPMTCIYKIVLLKRLFNILCSSENTSTGPTAELINVCRKYDALFTILNKAFITGKYLNALEWKKMVTTIVMKRDKKRFNVQCHLYKVLQYYDFKEAVGNISIRWEHAFKYPKYARKIRSVIRLLINVDRYGFSLCESCDNFVANTIEHVLFD